MESRKFLTVPTSDAIRPYPEPTPIFLLRLRDTSSRNTPPEDPSGGVVYLRIVLYPEEASRLMGNS
jgi:hypothetical protein